MVFIKTSLLLAFLTCSTLASTTTPDQLLDKLREKQINAMVKEQKKASELKVPEELAKAASLEAKKRVLAAESDIFEINATPYSPFSADKSTKNLGYLGRGYDVLYGNPLDESGRVDPGFRLQAVELEYVQNRFSADGEYRIPDNADVIMEPSALFSSSFNDVRTESDYKQTLKEDVKTTSGFGLDAGFVSISGEFSQSKSYQSTKESIKKGGKVNIDIVGRATAYKAWLHTVGSVMKGTKALQKAIEDLPEACTEKKDVSSYFRLIQTFGTHFTTVVTMGAKAVQRLTMTTKESMDLKRKGISTNQVVSASVGFMAKGVSASAKFGREESSSSDTTLSNTLKNMNIQKREFYIGGEPPSESYYSDDNKASTASLRQWGRSAFERPVPIQYELQQLIGLFNKKYLPDVTESKISSKKTCMEDALKTYCDKVAVDKEECVSYQDGDGVKDVIRYGDFISIKKLSSSASTKYLAVTKDFPKFTQGTQAQDFKVVPVDTNAYWKYGKALHYQEPFNLVSEYGGQQGIVKCLSSGSSFKYNLFNYGKQRVTCTKQDNPVGEWQENKHYWCNKGRTEALTFDKLTVDQCKRKCLELTNGECKAIQYFGSSSSSICAHCDKPDEIVRHPDNLVNVPLPGYVYRRDVTKHDSAQRPGFTATLYFTSPNTKKKAGSLVMKNDQVHIGVSSYEQRKQLYDVRRPAFLGVVSNDVEVKEDSGSVVNLNQINCKDGLLATDIQNPLACSYWWKVQVTKKTLHTYPRVHFETISNPS